MSPELIPQLQMPFHSNSLTIVSVKVSDITPNNGASLEQRFCWPRARFGYQPLQRQTGCSDQRLVPERGLTRRQSIRLLLKERAL
jgi:hypothetical protein